MITGKRTVNAAILALAPILLALAGGVFEAAHAGQQESSCDFVTGGGQILTSGGRPNFGVAGGVKRGAFWGHLHYHDKANDLKVEDRYITAYYATGPRTRVIEGTARTDKYGDRAFRVTVSDFGKRDNDDWFRIDLDNGYFAQGNVRKGEIKIHKRNRDSTPPPNHTCQPEPADTQAPTVAVTSPSNGATVSGMVTISASASDDTGVAGVQFYLDGVPFGAEDLTAPYEIDWDTTTATNGTHTIKASARDAAGNTAISSEVSVTVSNGPPPDTTKPTVSITSPACGSTVSGNVTVEATASDNVGVTAVEFFVDGTSLGVDTTADANGRYSVSWDTTVFDNGNRTLAAVARDAAGNSTTSPACTVSVANLPPPPPPPPPLGTVFVALVNGDVHEYTPEGVLVTIWPGTSNGQSSSLAFDASGNMYVPHWFDPISQLLPGNTIERFTAAGLPLGSFGSGYDCNPSSVDFDAAGNVYVGQADCSGDIFKFSPTGTLVARYDVAVQARGTDHIDLAADNCTMFYSSRAADILRYNVCTGTQLSNFNTTPLPDAPYHIELLPDGGLLIANGTAGITRLDASGNFVTSYFVPGPPGSGGNLWGGVDLAPDGTSFWASNGFNGDIARFDIQTGAVLNFFNTGTGQLTAAGVEVRP